MVQNEQHPSPPPVTPLPPDRFYPEPPPSRGPARFISRLLWAILLLILMISLGFNLLLFIAVGLAGLGGWETEGRVRESFVAYNPQGENKVAVFSIEGVMLNPEGFFRRQIDHARQDAKEGKLKALVVRINSPGGSVAAAEYMLYHLRKLAKDFHLPVVVSMGQVAASGGYYVAMCVGDTPESIFAEPGTWTGSIGVLIPHYDLSELLKTLGVAENPVVSHPLKTMGSFARKMTPEERNIFQALVDESFQRFKTVVREGRPRFQRDPAALDKLATGQIFSAEQARESGLVDRIGFLEDAIERAIELAYLDKENVKVVRYKSETRLLDLFFGRGESHSSLDLAALFDLATPRAYYLCTWLPAAISSSP